MTTVLALLAVGLGSLGYRLLPLLGAAHVPDQVSRVAGWAGLSVLVAVTVRGVLHHRDDATPGAVAVAVLAVALGLVLAARRLPMPVVLAVGAGCYLLVAAVMRALT